MGLNSGMGVKLTYREKQVLRLCGQGLPAKEIAKKLSVSTRTVDFHRKNIYLKLDVPNVMAAVAAVADIRWPDEYALPQEAHHA